MRTHTIQRTMNTACGKTISYIQTTGQVAKAHSTEGPAIIYPDVEAKSPEYYLYGIKYSKIKWKEALTQHKMPAVGDPIILDQQY